MNPSRVLLAAALLLCSPAARAVECAAEPGGEGPDDAALQACLDRGGEIELKPGAYRIANGLHIRRSGTVLDGGNHAVLVAEPALDKSLLRAGGAVRGYTVKDIVFDGNAAARTRLDLCSDGSGLGPTTSFEGGGFRIHGVTVMRTMCGSAMIVLGSRFEIFGNKILDNGRSGDQAPGIPAPWADGMTVLLCDHGAIYDNTFEDNTDIALVVGGGPNCNVQRNQIFQKRKHAFAGLNVGNFNNNGNHSGSVYANNDIRSAKDMLVWGLQLGAHPWSQNTQVKHAGTVMNNRISGAMVNIAVDGIGAGELRGNVASNPQGTYGYGVGGPGNDPEGCRKAANYTAADFGDARLQPGYVARVYHDGRCPDVREDAPEPDAAR